MPRTGVAFVTTPTGGIASTRTFKLGTTNTDSTAASGTWEITAGGTLTLYYREYTSGASTPSAPDSVALRVYYETGTGLLIRTLHSGARPASGTSYTFHGTNTGAAGGSPRAGTVRLYVQAEFDGTVGDYNVDSDGNALVGAINASDAGGVRVRAEVTAMVHGGYPAGATYAYGTAADEILTLTATHTQPYAVRGHEDCFINVSTGVSTKIVGATKDIANGTSTAQTFVINNGFDSTSSLYGGAFAPTGNSTLMTGDKWTTFVGSGVGGWINDGVNRQDFYTVDPRLTMGTITPVESLYNRGEATSADFSLTNARAETVTRSLSCVLKDSLAAIKKTVSLSGATKQMTYTVGVSDDAANDLTGAQWTIETNVADVTTQVSGNAFKVSSKLTLESASAVETIYNRGESVQYTLNLNYARGADYASKSSVTSVVKAAGGGTEDTVASETTDATGVLVRTYSVAVGDEATNDLTGSPKDVQVTHSGNDTGVLPGNWAVSSLLKLPTLYHGKTDLDANTDLIPDSQNETDFFVGADVLYTKMQVHNVRDENYSGAACQVQVLRSATQEEVDVGGTSTANGYQDLFYDHNVVAPAGERTVRYTATKDGNTVTEDAIVNYAPSYTGNIEVTALCEFVRADGTIRILAQPFVLTTSNTRQTVTEAGATVNLDPQITLLSYGTTFSEVVAATTMTAEGADHYSHTYTGLAVGYYVAEIALTLNGGQLTESVCFGVGKPDKTFDPTGLFA